MPRIHWRPGLRPGPRSGSSRRSPRSPSRLGRGTPQLVDAPLFGSIVILLSRGCLPNDEGPGPPQIFFPRTATVNIDSTSTSKGLLSLYSLAYNSLLGPWGRKLYHRVDKCRHSFMVGFRSYFHFLQELTRLRGGA